MPGLQYRAVMVPIQAINPANGQLAGGTARIDTGADITLIDSSVIAQIGATPVSSTEVQGIDGNPVMASTYSVAINLGQFGYISSIRVAAIDGLVNRDGFQCLLGTDALSTGVLDYEGLNQQFSLQLGIGTGPPVSPTPTWMLPAGVIAGGLGLAAIIYLMTG